MPFYRQDIPVLAKLMKHNPTGKPLELYLRYFDDVERYLLFPSWAVPYPKQSLVVERRLFPDGGYYLDNGALLCERHHLEAEETTISCEELRGMCGFKNIVLPPRLYPDTRYNKWGNLSLDNGMRLKDELFDDPSVQKVLNKVIHLFTNCVKSPYPSFALESWC